MPGAGHHPNELLVRDVEETSQTRHAIDIVHGCLLELHVTIIFLETSYNLSTKHIVIALV